MLSGANTFEISEIQEERNATRSYQSGSEYNDFTKPCWGHAILRRYIRPAAKNQGIEKRIGWHTFRRTYATLVRSVGTEFKVMQELMRHSSMRSTLDIYAQAITPAKHAAQAAVVSLMFPPELSSSPVSDSAENVT